MIEIDREHDLAYLLLQPELRDRAGTVSRSVQIGDDIVLDLDGNEQIVGIEMLHASKYIDLEKTREGEADLIVGVKEAAEMLGVEKSNFVRDHANKPKFPRPIAELASGRLWIRSDIDRYMSDLKSTSEQSPLFAVGEVVTLRSDPQVLLPILEIIRGGLQYRYKVFQNNMGVLYYETQLQRPTPSNEGQNSITVSELHAHLTSFQILAPSTTHLFSLRSGRVTFVPYQYRPVLRLIRADRPRLLIADEVGVGKTIEAGLILKELRARMDLASVLIICPKALVAERKWSNEMKRFDETFNPIDGPLLRHCLQETDLEGEWPEQYNKAIMPFSLFDSELVLGRKDQPKRNRLGLLDLNPPPKFDLVIVDEAHHIRNSETMLHQGIRYFCDNAQAVLLLTATPVQLGSNDLFTLLNVLRPDLVIDHASFEQMAAPNPSINHAIQLCRTASRDWQREAQRALEEAGNTQWGRLFLRDAPVFRDSMTRLSRNSIGAEERIAITRSLEELYTFSPMINRTRRRDIGEFTTRKPETVAIDFTPSQKHLHDQLLSVIATILELNHGQQNVKFMMTTVRRQAASCLYGLAPLFADILGNKLNKLEFMEASDDDEEGPDFRLTGQIRTEIDSLLASAKTLDATDPKVQAFIGILSEKGTSQNNKTLVFSTFRHTLAYLNAHAQNAGLRVALIHGDVPDDERMEFRRRFSLPKENESAIDVLLSSEVGCEGLDFQFCDFLINYDLPWNPMRIEQRIGRIDRYGQKSPTVGIVNFITPGTVDADIYERCLWRIGVFQHAVGGNEEILGELTKEIHAIAESLSLNENDRVHRLQQLADNTIRQVREEQELETTQSELFGLDVPSKSWREDIKSFETFWLSSSAIQTTVKTYLAARLESSGDHILGDKPLKTLRLNQEARGRLLDDYRGLPRGTEPPARDWEKYLKGSQPTLSITFEQEAATDNQRAAYLSVLHPLVRQAARFWEIKEPKYCSLFLQSDEIPNGQYRFALYRWSKHGVRVDEQIVSICEDGRIEPNLLDLLQKSTEATSLQLPGAADCDALEVRQHLKWANAQTQHIEENRRTVDHRIQSLTVSHQARRSAIQDQLSRATNDRIRLMKESELMRANADFDQRLFELQQAADSADIRATPLVFGTLTVEG